MAKKKRIRKYDPEVIRRYRRNFKEKWGISYYVWVYSKTHNQLDRLPLPLLLHTVGFDRNRYDPEEEALKERIAKYNKENEHKFKKVMLELKNQKIVSENLVETEEDHH